MRRTVIKVRAAALLVVAVILGLLSAQMASATTQMTATVGVNIRSGPSTRRGNPRWSLSWADGHGHQQFPRLDQDQICRLDRPRCQQVPHQGTKLPAPSRIGPGTVKITTTALNLRTGPGLSYKVIKVLKEGAKVTMTGKTARGWAQLVNGRSTGWSSMQYLARLDERTAGDHRQESSNGRS